jgi:hypothetical protein
MPSAPKMAASQWHMACRRMGVEWSAFVLQRSATALVVPVAIALRDDAANSRRLRRLDQIVCSGGAQAICQREFIVELPEALRLGEARHLMNDDFRANRSYRSQHCVPVKPVGNRAFGTLPVKLIHLLRRMCHRKPAAGCCKKPVSASTAPRVNGRSIALRSSSP